MQVAVFETPSLGDRSYLVHDGSVALVIDPQRDIDRLERAASDAGVRTTHVAETHLHNDYVSGGLELAIRHGAAYLVNADDEVEFGRQPVRGGDTIEVGQLSVTVVATPGHTATHLSYVVRHGGDEAVFSGGSLLYGSVGRTDLVAPDRTVPLTHAQYASVRRLVAEAQPRAALYPTHGFGSFCSSGPATGATESTVGAQLETNHALTDTDEDHFVRTLIADLGAYPSYYAHMGPINAQGAGPVDLDVPVPLDAATLQHRLADGEWVVDLRNRVAFAADQLAGSVSFEYGDGASFTSILGWVRPWGERLTLVGSRTDVEAAIRDLARIGIDAPAAALGSDPYEVAPGVATQHYPRVGWAGVLAGRQPADVLLDVRRPDEYAVSHLAGALHVPVYEVLARASTIPPGRLWVHCASGYRSGVAASLLERTGRDVVHIDDEYDAAAAAGITVVRS